MQKSFWFWILKVLIIFCLKHFTNCTLCLSYFGEGSFLSYIFHYILPSIWWQVTLLDIGGTLINFLGRSWPHWSSSLVPGSQHFISPWTKWPPFRRQNLQMRFHEWKVFITIHISLKFVPWGSIDNKSALVQVMAWHQTTNIDPVCQHIYASLEGDELGVSHLQLHSLV